MKVLITGGTGTLGRILAGTVAGAGHTVRIMSLAPRSSSDPVDVEWALANLATGEGMREAVEGAWLARNVISVIRGPDLRYSLSR